MFHPSCQGHPFGTSLLTPLGQGVAQRCALSKHLFISKHKMKQNMTPLTKANSANSFETVLGH